MRVMKHGVLTTHARDATKKREHTQMEARTLAYSLAQASFTVTYNLLRRGYGECGSFLLLFIPPPQLNFRRRGGQSPASLSRPLFLAQNA